MDVLRTPDEAFTGLPGYDFAPHYLEVASPAGTDGTDTLRMHYLDEGPSDGPVVVLLHGEPSWCYLYRHMVGPLAAAGLRVIAPDLIGFGRSDKPADPAEHTYARQVAWTSEALLDALDLHDITLVCQDWGGLIGLRIVAAHPDRFAGVVAANTGLPDGAHRMPEVWWRFHDFVQRTPDLPIGFLVAGACTTALPPEVVAAYEAPFPDASYKAGPRAMPGLIPQTAEDVETPRQQQAWAALETFDKPFLCAFSDQDPITRGGDRPFLSRVPGTRGQPHTTIEGGGHFLQEDRGPQLAAVVASFVAATR